MSTHFPGFLSVFSGVLHHLVLAKLATSSIRVKDINTAVKSTVVFGSDDNFQDLSFPSCIQ